MIRMTDGLWDRSIRHFSARVLSQAHFRRPRHREHQRIEQALAGLKHVMRSSDRAAILQWTKVLNDATQHLAEVMMNRSVKQALTGKSIDGL